MECRANLEKLERFAMNLQCAKMNRDKDESMEDINAGNPKMTKEDDQKMNDILLESKIRVRDNKVNKEYDEIMENDMTILNGTMVTKNRKALVSEVNQCKTVKEGVIQDKLSEIGLGHSSLNNPKKEEHEDEVVAPAEQEIEDKGKSCSGAEHQEGGTPSRPIVLERHNCSGQADQVGISKKNNYQSYGYVGINPTNVAMKTFF